MVAPEPARDERVGHRAGGVAHEQRRLQGQGEPLDQAAGAATAASGPSATADAESHSSIAASSTRSWPRARASSLPRAAREAGSRVSARTTSRALTLPEPSQIELSGASR